uniref:Ribonuclease n=1 Tax=Aplanochytrium stocchinoi TaxID=215587 RepID=A0A7S3PM92_9STRA|mmetsp:Transcript_24347/g.29716  ORF Transcript_24347/g.29716 Transcript_24347/m.29716 type:complete len:356 (+) Transcript_24347:217-1284(+)|eukprot:CAMPEP_0204840222 /NCGR_PEP_ID=MMETSP1346-20131115/36879_1 /ASSEMBLY_ACC=CAM_ASM_000771 /TAXON_ID=215587 /ORGANISM="Aplanochytrium stocchinoi, Strain GSBS06" /LENGTH=355 /DNA_ID=CAMNT_0051977479 /DNA_START=188 /DNA_END=1255 /DNA_ORIENTATION=+
MTSTDGDYSEPEEANSESETSTERSPKRRRVDADAANTKNNSVCSNGSFELHPIYEMSKLPEKCANNVECSLGIDEAGRGPVLGPMIFGMAFWPTEMGKDIEKHGFDDSKALKEEERDRMHEDIVTNLSDRVGHGICILSAEHISCQMTRRSPVSLNAISQNATIQLIQKAYDLGANITEIYVDAVGNCDFYQKKLSSCFPRARVTVKPKADHLFKVVSAASIRAKCSRDRMVKNWRHREQNKSVKFQPLNCSGYPGDSATVKWLRDNFNTIFGYPCVARFSWKTVRRILNEDGEKHEELSGKLPEPVRVEWETKPTDADGNDTSFGSMKTMFAPYSKRAPFFKSKRIEIVQNLL